MAATRSDLGPAARPLPAWSLKTTRAPYVPSDQDLVLLQCYTRNMSHSCPCKGDIMTVEEILKATGINIGDNGIGADTLRYDGWLPCPLRILSSKPAQRVVCQRRGIDHSFLTFYQFSMQFINFSPPAFVIPPQVSTL